MRHILRSAIGACLQTDKNQQLAGATVHFIIGVTIAPGIEANLARLHGDPRSVRSFASMPVMIVAYSGGYLATAWSVHHGGLGKRLRGVVLFDALYGELDTFADWVTRQNSAFFVSTYTRSTEARNVLLQKVLAERQVPFTTSLEPRLLPGSVAFLHAPKDAGHRDFLTYAWIDEPLRDLLARLRSHTRR